MLAVHLKHGMTRHIINTNQLEKGMVVFLRYTTIGGENRQYVATVLNPMYEKKLHILSMNEIGLDIESLLKVLEYVIYLNFKKQEVLTYRKSI